MTAADKPVVYGYDRKDVFVQVTDDLEVTHTIHVGTDPKKAIQNAARNERIKKIVARLLVGAAVLTTVALLGGVIAHSMNAKLGIPIKLPLSLGIGLGLDGMVIGSGIAFSAAHSTAETAIRATKDIDQHKLAAEEARRAREHDALSLSGSDAGSEDVEPAERAEDNPLYEEIDPLNGEL